MKALSIYPEPVMDIFMGLKTIEYRTWSTDYRGDLLICAGAKKEPGFVNGYAWFVVSLLNVLPFDAGWEDGPKGYEWVLGEPRLIRPIPVRGRLFLFDVDDALIRYIEGGDLGAFQSPAKANEFRREYIRKYLEPLAYRPSEDTPLWGYAGLALASEPPEPPEPPKPQVDMPVDRLLEAVVNLDPLPPMTVEIGQAYPELERGLAHYPSQKVGVVKWLEGLIKRKKTSGREAYNDRRNLVSLLWLVEALGESRGTLTKALESAMAYDTMPQRCDAF